MDLDIFNPTRQLRRVVLFWLSNLLLCVSMAVVAASSFSGELSLPHYAASLFAMFSVIVSYQCYRQHVTPRLTSTYIYSLIAVVSLFTYSYPIEYGIFVWTCIYPVLFYLFLGMRHGFIASAVGFTLELSMISQCMTKGDNIASIYLFVNFSLVFLSIWFASHVLEVKRRTSEASLGQLASRDSLTGVYNRHALVHNFERYHDESERLPLSLLILDLDYFKAVNDAYGHDVGDKVLTQTAALLDAYSEEHLVYRIGGEEFCIALHNTNSIEAKQKAEYLRAAIENFTFNDSKTPISLTVSIGVYQCDHYADLESVLSAADKELYRAKRGGRNRVMVNERPLESNA